MAGHTPTIIAMTTLALPLSSTAIGALRQLAVFGLLALAAAQPAQALRI